MTKNFFKVTHFASLSRSQTIARMFSYAAQAQVTKIQVRASVKERGYFVSYPTVLTTLTDQRGVQASSRHQIYQSHIEDFSAVRIDYLNNNSPVLCPRIVLDYQPVRVITVTVTTER